jgi:hypothetical protein
MQKEKNVIKKSLKLATIQHQKENKRVESTQIADPLRNNL